MKPVAIFRFSPGDEPGRFAQWLDANARPWRLIALHAGEPVPEDVTAFAGIGMMGGPMSVNDSLPWVAPMESLLRKAVERDIPVIGHCLGGQLMSKAFGGAVVAAPLKEIGWGEVRVSDNSVARKWLGELQAFESFHWHGETFSIPPGATRVLENRHCANQAFALGKHLGMQCHVEMTPELIRTWLDSGRSEIDSAKSAAVQRPEEIDRNVGPRLEVLHEVADRIYERWTEGLSRGS